MFENECLGVEGNELLKQGRMYARNGPYDLVGICDRCCSRHFVVHAFLPSDVYALEEFAFAYVERRSCARWLGERFGSTHG